MAGYSESDIFFSIATAVLFVVCLIGNSVILTIIYKNQVFGDICQARLLIANAAIVDLVSSIDFLTSSVGYMNHGAVLENGILCQIEGTRRWAAKLLTHFSLLLLASSRYYAIAKPLVANIIFSRRVCLIFVGGMWLLVLSIVVVLGLLGNFKVHLSPDRSSCMLVVNTIPRLCILVLVLCLAISTIIVHAKTWWQYRLRMRRVGVSALVPNSNIGTALLVTKPILIITIYYVISFLPIICMLVAMEGFRKTVPMPVFRLGRLLYTSNHANNLIVFLISSKRFRASCMKLFYC